MAGFVAVLFVFLGLQLLQQSTSFPLCTDLRSPVKTNTSLFFCPYTGSVCCDSSKDAQLHKQFLSMNISDPTCASLLKSILCATCDPFAADLFQAGTGDRQKQRPVPVLCNSTSSGGSHSSKESTSSFCSIVWNTCKDISIPNSPFAPSLQGRAGGAAPITSKSSTLADLWQSEGTFCDAFGSSTGDDTTCFNGEPVKLNNTGELDVPPKGLCLEKIGTGSYINMAPHPDGSNRAFFSNLPGNIWLAKIPEQDAGDKLDVDESEPFVDLTDEVLYDTTFGMLGMAFHPNFAQNGRFFASYNCDRLKSQACAGRCACNSDVDCDPSKFNSSGSGTAPCQIQSVIAEFTANGSGSNPSSGKPSEVRRIFTMGLPNTNDHGGQILFGPDDGYLYVMMGDAGGRGDPYSFAQNKKSILGKILRLDIDNIPSEKEIDDLGLWGHYAIPQDNPYTEDKQLAREIWAMGFRNPWRCSFDAERPSYFLCADVGQDQYEEVDVVTKGGNYGWNTYEGPIPFNTKKPSATNDTLSTQNVIFPVSGYTHKQVNNKIGSAAISGGFFYRSETDPCMSGRYLYGDLYAANIWAATESPKDSGNFSTAGLPFSCAHDSPIPCGAVPGTALPALGYIYSFAQDNRKDIFILSSNGVYRVVRPSRCNYACSKESVRPAKGPTTSPSSPSNNAQGSKIKKEWLFTLLSLLLLECLYIWHK